MVEHTGFEPVTSTLPVLRATNCANAPLPMYVIMFSGGCQSFFKQFVGNAASRAERDAGMSRERDGNNNRGCVARVRVRLEVGNRAGNGNTGKGKNENGADTVRKRIRDENKRNGASG